MAAAAEADGDAAVVVAAARRALPLGQLLDRLAALGKGEQLGREIDGLVKGLLSLVKHVKRLLFLIDSHPCHVDIAEYALKQVVKIMCNASSESPNGLELLGLKPFFLEEVLLADERLGNFLDFLDAVDAVVPYLDDVFLGEPPVGDVDGQPDQAQEPVAVDGAAHELGQGLGRDAAVAHREEGGPRTGIRRAGQRRQAGDRHVVHARDDHGGHAHLSPPGVHAALGVSRRRRALSG